MNSLKISRCKKMKSKAKRLLANEKGQGMVEYVITITSISLVALLNLRLIGTMLDSAMTGITMAI